MDVNELQVLACDPPRDAVRVHVAGGSYVELFVPPSITAVEHAIAMRRGALTLINGHGPTPPLDALAPEDLLLASVRMPANTSTVQQWQIVDRRSWDDRGRLAV